MRAAGTPSAAFSTCVVMELPSLEGSISDRRLTLGKRERHSTGCVIYEPGLKKYSKKKFVTKVYTLNLY